MYMTKKKINIPQTFHEKTGIAIQMFECLLRILILLKYENFS